MLKENTNKSRRKLKNLYLTVYIFVFRYCKLYYVKIINNTIRNKWFTKDIYIWIKCWCKKCILKLETWLDFSTLSWHAQIIINQLYKLSSFY